MSGICKLGNPPHSLEKYKSHANFGKDYSTEHIEKKQLQEDYALNVLSVYKKSVQKRLQETELPKVGK